MPRKSRTLIFTTYSERSWTMTSAFSSLAHTLLRLVEGVRVPVLGRDALIQNKRAAERHKDLADVEALEKGAPRRRER